MRGGSVAEAHNDNAVFRLRWNERVGDQNPILRELFQDFHILLGPWTFLSPLMGHDAITLSLP